MECYRSTVNDMLRRNTIQFALFLLIFGVAFLLGAFAYRAGWVTAAKSKLVQWISNDQLEVDEISESPSSQKTSFAKQYLSMNEMPLSQNEKPISFVVAGHIYGSHEEDDIHPAITLLTQLQVINKMNLDMALLLGDVVPHANPNEFDRFERFFLKYLTFPAYNAVGNHDVEDRDLYWSRYGETVFAFTYKEHLFIFLDTTRSYCSLTVDQFDYIKEHVSQTIKTSPLKGIHLLMHHVLFLDAATLTQQTMSMPNETCPPVEVFNEFMWDYLVPLSKQVPVYMYAGDVGAWNGNLTPYYEKLPDSNVTCLATGLGHSQMDSVIIARERDGELHFEVFSLTGKDTLPIDTYTYSYWIDRAE